jgi:hypothetical protein
MKLTIKRWNEKELRYIDESKQMEESFAICGMEDHNFCRHEKATIALRSSRITDVEFYPALKELVIRVTKEKKHAS